LARDPRYFGYRAGAIAARSLPSAALPTVSRVLGAVGARSMGGRRAVVERNLRRIHGTDISQHELDREVGQVFDSYARYWLESFRLPGTHSALIEDGMAVDGYEHIDEALEKGGGVILALPHLGGWEWAAFWLAESKGRTVTAVAEPVEPPELAEWFVGLRRDIGINVVPLGPSAGTECVHALKANDILCLLCDRDLAGGGVEVEFFGERTTLPGGPATLALRSGAPLLPTAVYFDGTGHLGLVRPPLGVERRGKLRDDVARITQDLANELEFLIRRAPDQWHLMQPNWPSDHEELGKTWSEDPGRG
jgi:phosphatidylinositol dimannoside acyltransferase